MRVSSRNSIYFWTTCFQTALEDRSSTRSPYWLAWRALMTRIMIAVALLALSAGPALAHSFPKTAQPAGGSTVKNAPSEVVILFTEALEPKFSSLQVFDAQNHEVDR